MHSSRTEHLVIKLNVLKPSSLLGKPPFICPEMKEGLLQVRQGRALQPVPPPSGAAGGHAPLWGQAELGHQPRAGARIRPNEDPLQAHSLAWVLSLQDSWWWSATCLPHWPGFSVRVVLWLHQSNPGWDWNTEVLLSSLIIHRLQVSLNLARCVSEFTVMRLTVLLLPKILQIFLLAPGNEANEMWGRNVEENNNNCYNYLIGLFSVFLSCL